nr:zinc-binding dehydrogenase [Ignavibacteria bacterium]
TSGNDEKIKKAVSLGAKAGVNYNNSEWHKEINEISGNNLNVAIDSTGGNTLSNCMEIINPGGRIVSYGAGSGNVKEFNIFKLYWKQLQIFGSSMGSDMDFTDMLKFINENKIIPVIDNVLSFEDFQKGFELLNSGSQFGKIVLNLCK